MPLLRQIENLLLEGKADEAILQIEKLLFEGENRAMLYYYRGNAWRMKGEWQKAMNDYLQAHTLNPQGPAIEAYQLLEEIQRFFNKDLYNH